MKKISTRTHGVIDYTWVATAAVLASALDAAPVVRKTLFGAALAALGTSLFTRYEYGLVRAIPMKGHLAFDAVLGSTLLAAPSVLQGADSRGAQILAALGLSGMVVGAMTETESPQDREMHQLENVEPISATMTESVTDYVGLSEY